MRRPGPARSSIRAQELAGLLLSERGTTPLERPGSSLVGLSQTLDSRLEDNQGTGVHVATVTPFMEGGPHGRQIVIDPILRLEGLTLERTGGVGVFMFHSAGRVRESVIRESHGIGFWGVSAAVQLIGNEIADTLVGRLDGREGESRTSLGVTLSGSGDPAFDAGLAVEDNRITGMSDAGLLVVTDLHPLGGRLALGETGRLSDNGLDAARIGRLGELEVEGFELTPRTAEELPPPELGPQQVR